LNGFLPFTARVSVSTGEHVWSQQWTSTTLGQSAGVVCASAVRQCYHAFTTTSQLQLWTLDYGAPVSAIHRAAAPRAQLTRAAAVHGRIGSGRYADTGDTLSVVNVTGFPGQLLHSEDMAMAVRPGASHEGRVLLSYLVRNANTSVITATVFDVEAYVHGAQRRGPSPA